VLVADVARGCQVLLSVFLLWAWAGFFFFFGMMVYYIFNRKDILYNRKL
jgi:hypothetical protein